MKFSTAILLSTTFVLMLPVASLAAEPALPTTIFLRDSLATLSSGKASTQQTLPKKQKVHSLASLEPKMDVTSYQTFLPGRYLPSEAELRQKEYLQKEYQGVVKQPYIKLSAKVDPSLLSGQILLEEQQSVSAKSSKSIRSSKDDKEALSNLGFVLAQKVTAGVRQLINPDHHPKNYYSSYPKNPTTSFQKDFSFNLPSNDSQTNSSRLTSLKEYSHPQKTPTLDLATMPNVIEPPVLSRYQQAQLADLVDSNLPQSNSGLNNSSKMHDYAVDNLAINNQQSKLPLNLIAGQLQAMKTGRRSHKLISGRPASFGAWHNNGQLPKTSFSSYISSKSSTGLYSLKTSTGSKHTGKQSPFAKTRLARKSLAPMALSAQATRKTAKKQDPYVANYSPYKRYNYL